VGTERLLDRGVGLTPAIELTDVRLHWVGIDHAEGLAFAADGVLWAGGEQGQIYRGQPDDESPALVGYTPGRTLGFAVDADGVAFCADMTAPGVFRIDPDGEITRFSAGAESRPMRVPNALSFTPDGLLLVTDSGDWDDPTGCIFAIDASGETWVADTTAAHYPNGIAVSPDGRSVAVVESSLPGVSLLSLEQGVLSGRRVLAELPGTVPDGVAWDAEGRLLVACWSPDAVFLVDSNGEVTLLAHDPIRFTFNQPTNVAFAPGTTRVVAANIGERFLSSFEHDCAGGIVHRPVFAR
jgi:gluconolactonase